METTVVDKPKVVGLTGGIAAGKSSARKAFALLKVPCVDTDAVARGIHQDPAHPATREIAMAFADWMTEDGALQRGSLQGLFARNASANRTLIAILKPHVLEAIHRWTELQRAPYVVWESALFLQEDIAVDSLLIVDAPVALRIARIHSRNPDWSEQDIANILAMQAVPPSERMNKADVLSNDSSPERLQEQVRAIHARYTTLWS